MKILIVSQYFWPENFRINDLALGLRKKGHAVTVLTGMPNYPEGRFFKGYGFFGKTIGDYQGIRVIRVPLVPRGPGTPLRLALNYISFAVSGSLLGPLFSRETYDCIFVFQMSPATMGIPALVLKKIKGVPLLWWVQDLWPESLSATGHVRSESLLGSIGMVMRWLYHGCDRILIQSKAFASSVEKFGVMPNKIFYFPNSAEELYKPIRLKENDPEHALLPVGFRVMFAGNIGAAQDFETILSAAEILKEKKDIHWIVVGDGSRRQWVEDEVRMRGLGETVHLLGRHPIELMPRLFALSDALLVTLTKRPIFSLTIPSKIQSYLACARPIIAALDGEGARIVQEAGAGVICPTENPGRLAESVLSVYGLSEDERSAMGRRGRVYFEKTFERNMLLAQLEKWMDEMRGSPAAQSRVNLDGGQK